MKEKFVAGEYQDYYRIVPGPAFAYFKKGNREKIKNSDTTFKLDDATWENFLEILNRPAILCVRKEECREFFKKFDKKLLKEYICLKKKTDKNNKQLIYTLKEIERIISSDVL